MECLHKNFFVYRDIKPENILLDHERHAEIWDFEFVKPDMDVNEFAYSLCESPEYMPTESSWSVETAIQ